MRRKSHFSHEGGLSPWKSCLLFSALLPALINLAPLMQGGTTSTSQPSNLGGAVKETLVLENNTLLPGNAGVRQGISPSGIVYDRSNEMLYVSDLSSSAIFVVSTSTNSIVKSIPVGLFPDYLVYNEANGYIYVGSGGADFVSVIDGATNSVIANVTTGAPISLVYDSSNHYVYVINQDSDSISVINDTRLLMNVQLHGNPTGIAYDSNSGYLYLVSGGTVVSILDPSTNHILSNITLSSPADSISYDASNQMFYLSWLGSNNITVFDPRSYQTVDTISAVPFIQDIIFDPANRYMYVMSEADGALVFNSQTNAYVGKVQVPFAAGSLHLVHACYDPSNQNVYATLRNSGSSSIAVIDTSTGNVTAFITLDVVPTGMAFSQNTDTLYVAMLPNPINSTMGVISGATSKITNSFAMPFSGSVGYDPLNRYLYVAEFGTNEVAVINSSTTKVVGQMQLGSIVSTMVFDPSNGYMYFGGIGPNPNATLESHATVWAIDGTRAVANMSIDAFPYGMTFDSKNGNVYVTNLDSATISVINGTRVTRTIAVAVAPYGIAYDGSDGFLYLTHSGSNNVSVVDPSSGLTIANVTAGDGAGYVLFDPANKLVYVADFGPQIFYTGPLIQRDNVTVINGTSALSTIAVGSRPFIMVVNPSNENVYVMNVGSGTISVISNSQPGNPLGYLPFLVPLTVIAVLVLVVLVAVNTFSNRQARLRNQRR